MSEPESLPTTQDSACSRIPLPEAECSAPIIDGVRRMEFCEIAGEGCEVIIMHQGQEYRLRCTNRGRLLLTK